MSWKCPKCESTNLRVAVRVFADLIQVEQDNFETEISGDCHEWDDKSAMVCKDCDYSAPSEKFCVEAD